MKRYTMLLKHQTRRIIKNRYIYELEKLVVTECVVTADTEEEAHDKFCKGNYEIISEKDYHDSKLICNLYD